MDSDSDLLSKKQTDPIIPNDNSSEDHQPRINRQKGREERIDSDVKCVGEFDARITYLGRLGMGRGNEESVR